MNVQKLEGDYAWDVRTEGCRSRQFGNDIEKYKNDYEILKKYLAEDPKQPRKQFYAAQSAFDSRMFDIAEQEYIKRTELESWAEEVYFSWLRVGMCRTILEKPIEMITDAMMRAYETKPDRAESLYHLSCIYRKYGRPRNAFLVASMGLTIPPPQNDILFVDMANYRWGLLDEVATTAFYVGKYHMGLAACEKLLSEPYLPEEHRPRVENNKNAYINAIAQIQGQINAQQAQTLANMQTVKIPEPKTTLKISPENLAVKL
jgi:hypothetical protein